MKTILVTGGAGFIGSHFVDLLVEKTNYSIIVLDKLTYAGKLENMSSFIDSKRVNFIKGDICDSFLVNSIFEKFDINYVVNFAAESHVDNSIVNSDSFVETNVIGFHVLLKSSFNYWNKNKMKQEFRFIQISTDEVYGSLGSEGSFDEDSNINPSNPYAATKAAADLIGISYFKTYQFPIIFTRSTNNYGSRQHEEKFIPKCIINSFESIKIPIYGNGMNVRNWIYVKDNVKTIFNVLKHGIDGEVYNIGSSVEISNYELAKKINNKIQPGIDLITFVEDRLGHDFRYSLKSDKVSKLKGNKSIDDFDSGLDETISSFLLSN